MDCRDKKWIIFFVYFFFYNYILYVPTLSCFLPFLGLIMIRNILGSTRNISLCFSIYYIFIFIMSKSHEVKPKKGVNVCSTRMIIGRVWLWYQSHHISVLVVFFNKFFKCIWTQICTCIYFYTKFGIQDDREIWYPKWNIVNIFRALIF